MRGEVVGEAAVLDRQGDRARDGPHLAIVAKGVCGLQVWMVELPDECGRGELPGLIVYAGRYITVLAAVEHVQKHLARLRVVRRRHVQVAERRPLVDRVRG